MVGWFIGQIFNPLKLMLDIQVHWHMIYCQWSWVWRFVDFCKQFDYFMASKTIFWSNSCQVNLIKHVLFSLRTLLLACVYNHFTLVLNLLTGFFNYFNMHIWCYLHFLIEVALWLNSLFLLPWGLRLLCIAIFKAISYFWYFL